MLGYELVANFDVSTTADLNTIVMVEENIAFAFGAGGACVKGSTIDYKKWRNCTLPQPEDVYAAAVVMEGPLRLPFPAPVANLQQRTAANEWLTVAQYPVVLESMNYRLSGEDVYIIDFSSFKTIGTYRFSIDGVGNSFSFQIAPSALDVVAYHTCRMLYYQRSGMPHGLQVPFAEARFSRPIDHEFNTSVGGRRIDGAYHWSIANSSLYDGESICPLKTKVCPAETTRDVSGGWFDAGDYGKYMSTAVAAVWRLLVTVEIMKAHNLPISDSMNIPESGDGVPDTLNEAKWSIDWMMKMQKADGGVFNKVAAEVWEWGPPATSDLGGQSIRFILPRTTCDTATAGAVFAAASRLWAPYNATFASILLNRAYRAKRFLQNHPLNSPAGGFVNPPGHISGPYYDIDDTDNRAWLAAELYRATCITSYGEEYVQFIRNASNVVAQGGNDFTDYRLEALWAFYYSKSCPNEPASFGKVRSTILTSMKNTMNGQVSMTMGNTYHNVGRTDVPEWIGWGSFTLTAAHFYGVLCWHIFNDDSNLDWLTLSLDTVLGANPLSMSFITGLGHKYPMDPLQGQSRTDNVVEPIPGYAVMGPYGHVSFKSSYFATAQGQKANYPFLTQLTSPFPVLRRWADSNLLPQYNEGIIGPMSWQCSVFQILAANSAVKATATK